VVRGELLIPTPAEAEALAAEIDPRMWAMFALRRTLGFGRVSVSRWCPRTSTGSAGDSASKRR
jgi:hypothetical protein